MDDTDRMLMLLVYENPRMTAKELSKRLAITRQAVARRMQVLTKLGVFKATRASISHHYLGVVPVYVWGRTTSTSVEEILERLGENELTSSVILLGGGHLHVFGALRDISELDGYVEFVKRVADMEEATVGIPCYGDGINPPSYDKGRLKQSHKGLSSLDLKIIALLQDDARKPLDEIAEIVGASAKTVRRHLSQMKLDGLLTFDMPWDIPSGEDMYTVMYVNLRSGADRVEVARRLIARDRIHIIYFRSFSNLPDFLIGLLKWDKMREIRRVLREIGEDEDVISVTPNLIYLERDYWSWDQKLPAALTRPQVKDRELDTRSRSKKQ